MDKEIYKASIQYHIGRVIGTAVIFTIICSITLSQIFSYTPTLLWYLISLFFLIWLYITGRQYHRQNAKMNEMLDNILEMREAWIKRTLGLKEDEKLKEMFDNGIQSGPKGIHKSKI